MSARDKTAACLDCNKAISARTKSGRCIPCGNRFRGNDPEYQRRRAEGIRRKFQDPAHREKMANVARRNGQKAAADPAHRAWLVENGKRLYRECLAKPGVRERNIAAIRANSHKITEHFLGWCPPEYRAEYRRLTISKRMKAADARAVIEAMIDDSEAVRCGELEGALNWLRRRAPVTKLPTGLYTFGSVTLRPGEVMRRAIKDGWRPYVNDNLVEAFLSRSHG